MLKIFPIIWSSRLPLAPIIKISNIFTPSNVVINNPNFYNSEKPFTIGNIIITPYLNDHSAFDAYSFLIEGEGQRLFYSGDFRGHGRKGSLLTKLTNNPNLANPKTSW